MKTQTKILASALCLCAMSVATAAEFEDKAQVVRVVPQMQQYAQPRQECRTVMVPVAQQPARSPTGAIVGGLAGGLLGSTVGRGTGRVAATAVGAVGGAVVGDQLANQNNQPVTTQQPVQECRTVETTESRPAGYEVTYRYRGKTFVSVLPYSPGRTIPVRVSVDPM